MRIIVIGDGKVGRTIVEHICQEGHEVVVIDTDPSSIEEVIENYDVMGIVGNGASYEILKSANASRKGFKSFSVNGREAYCSSSGSS